MVGYRLVRKRRASDAFSGEGARRYGGRWNTKNIPAVYGSEHLSLAVLEFRVNQASYDPEEGYIYFRFEFDPALVENLSDPPDGGRERVSPEGSKTGAQKLGENWLLEGRSAILSVPSTVLDVERNFVLNPRHPDFPKIQIGAKQELNLDPRLWITSQ
jgi:RES domain-containing protein